jgi:hypothetical protein
MHVSFFSLLNKLKLKKEDEESFFHDNSLFRLKVQILTKKQISLFIIHKTKNLIKKKTSKPK